MKHSATAIEQSNGMNPDERRSAIALAIIFMMRMLGLFMILPVFMLHADQYSGYTAAAAGFAFGVYGLTQGLFQIPFGTLSDHLGRKNVIAAGLLIFAIGSVVAALADSIVMVTVGRALQGLGAIAGAGLALLADLTRDEHRTKAMAIVGVSIGMAFALAMVLGPALAAFGGLAGLFWFTGILALGGIAILYWVVPDPAETHFHRDTETDTGTLGQVLSDGQLLRLDFGVLALHVLMTATFTVLPLALRDTVGLADTEHWKFYLPVLAASVVLMVPFIIYAERRARLKQALVGAVAVLALVELGLAEFPTGLIEMAILMVIYFTAFNLLEASLPSLVSRLAPPDMKGTAMGAYSTSQYLGAFIGGAGGGWAAGSLGPSAVYLGCAGLAAVWLAITIGMRNPRTLSNRLVAVGAVGGDAISDLTTRLLSVPGVVEAVVNAEDGIAYLKVDTKRLDAEALRAFSTSNA